MDRSLADTNAPFWRLDNVKISPHTADHTADSHERAIRYFIENLRRFRPPSRWTTWWTTPSSTEDNARPEMHPRPGRHLLTVSALVVVLLAAKSRAADPLDAEVGISAPARAVAGEHFEIRVAMNNRGPAPLENGFIAFASNSANATFIQVTESGVALSCTGLNTSFAGCGFATLAAGASKELVVRVLPARSVLPGGVVNLRAQLNGANADVDRTNSVAEATLAIDTRSDSVVTLSAPAEVVRGSDFTSVAAIRIDGPSQARSIELSYVLPAEAAFVSYTNRACCLRPTCTTPPVGETGTVRCQIDIAGPSPSGPAIVADFAFVLRPKPGASRLRHAVSLRTATPDPQPENNDATAESVVVDAPSAAANVTVTKVASPPIVRTGDPVTFTLTASNLGPAASVQTNIVDSLPPGMIWISASPECQGTTTVTCAVPNLQAGSQHTVTIVAATPSTAGTITNEATITSALDHVPDNNKSQVAVTVLPTTDADLKVAIDAPAFVGRGTGAGFVVQMTNAGPAAAAGVQGVFEYSGAELLLAVPLGPDLECETTAPSQTTGRITCRTTAPLDASRSRSFQVNVRPSADARIGDQVVATATVSAQAPDPEPANNSQSRSMTIAGNAVLAVQQVALDGEVAPGETFRSRVIVTNQGPDTARALAVRVQHSFGVATLETWSLGTCTGENPSLRCSIGDLPPNASAQLDLTFRAATLSTDFEVVVSASVTSDADRITFATTPLSVGHSVVIPRAADLAVTIEEPRVEAGDTLQTVSVSNRGPDAATNVWLRISMGTPLPTPVGAGMSCAPFGGSIVCSAAVLGSNSSASVTLRGPATAGRGVSAHVQADTKDVDPANNSATFGPKPSRRRSVGH